jgi:hypothetical protein
MRQIAAIIFLLVTCNANAQKRIHIKVFSIADSLPAKDYPLWFTKKTPVTSDSTGLVSVSTNKNTIRIRNVWDAPYSLDTTIVVKSMRDTIKIYTTRGFDSSQARYDIAHNRLQLFCGGGMLVESPVERDYEFEKTFGVRYNIMACVVADTYENLAAYNKEMAAFLDNKYGRDWRSKLRQDVHGITK